MKFLGIWRMTAALTLFVLVGLCLLTTIMVLTNILALLICLVLMFAIIWSTGSILISGYKYLIASWLMLITCLFLTLLIGYQASKHSKSTLFLAVGFGIVYVVLTAILRNHYWKLRKIQARKLKTGFKPKRPYLIVNPAAGNGRAIKAGIPNKARQMGIKVRITNKSDSIKDLTKKAVEDGADVIGVSGGDGTLGDIISVAIMHNIPVVVLPGGTRCHFAKDVGLHPRRIVDALESFWGTEQVIDVGKINGRVFLNNASFGLYADIIDNKEYRDHKLATTRSTLQSLLVDQDSRYDLNFSDAQGRKYKKAVQVLVGVNAYESVKVFELGQRRTLSGHLLQITAITELTSQLAKTMLGTVILNKNFLKNNRSAAVQWEAKQFTINAPSKSLVVGVDGERVEMPTPVNVEIVPSALRLLLPSGLSSQRPKNIFSLEIIVILWKATTGQQI